MNELDEVAAGGVGWVATILYHGAKSVAKSALNDIQRRSRHDLLDLTNRLIQHYLYRDVFETWCRGACYAAASV
jgi:hypothetical protein